MLYNVYYVVLNIQIVLQDYIYLPKPKKAGIILKTITGNQEIYSKNNKISHTEVVRLAYQKLK